MILREILDSIKNIAIAVVFTLIIIRYVGQTAIVNQESMQSTLHEGEVLWVEKITPALGKLKRGDIITVYSPQIYNNDYILVKRIVAIGGDFVEIKNGKVYVNGAALDEKYIKGTFTTAPENPKYNACTVPDGKVYALGDNRSISIYDSRNMGSYDIHDIRGRAIFRLWPLNKIGPMVNSGN